MNASVERALVEQAATLQISPALVAESRREAALAGEPVLERLRAMLGLGPEEVLRAVGAALQLPVFDLPALNRLEPSFEQLGFAESQARGCLALRDADRSWLVVSDPFDDALPAWCLERMGALPDLALAHAGDIAAWLARQEDSLRAIDTALPGTPAVGRKEDEEVEDLSMRSIEQGTSPVVRLVQSTLYDALRSGSSDVHFETHAHGLAIKYRLDGMLTQAGSVEGRELAEQVLSRLKVMSDLDIAERRVPQDGRFRLRAQGREIDFRVSVMPCVHGEDAVVRVLDKRALADQVRGLRLDVLGFDARLLADFRRLSRDPYGLVLVTGPTGSGKTTTLYAALSEIDHGHDKIVTIEDPVEYQLPGILQIPVNEKKGLTFARGLRSILRHDPDRIMVGEIRDAETAQIAIQAALTGHLVLSSVHANNSLDVIGRFTHMDVDPYSFVSALGGVLAQRLVRLVCPHCSLPCLPSRAALDAARVDPRHLEGVTVRSAQGCARCRGSGYKGRRAIGELLLLDDGLRELIVTRAPPRKIKEAAREAGTRFLREAAIALWLEGLTTLDEVNRVTVVA